MITHEIWILIRADNNFYFTEFFTYIVNERDIFMSIFIESKNEIVNRILNKKSSDNCFDSFSPLICMVP